MNWTEDRNWDKKVRKASVQLIPDEVPLKEFKPKNANLIILDKYVPALNKEYWEAWEVRKYEDRTRKVSWIDHVKLKAEAVRVGIQDQVWVDSVCSTMENGAPLGCLGEGRMPCDSKNSESSYEHGARVADSLQSYIKDGYMYGPYKKEDLPWVSVKVSPLTMRPKPDGSVRLIIDMSHPHNEDKVKMGEGIPMSINAAITGDMEVEMTSIKRWTGVLHRAGCPAEALKNDWNSAYKHVGVRKEDHSLQVLEWGGRYFIETQLVFGCKSSPFWYNEVARLLILIVQADVNLDSRLSVQQLDDNPVADEKGSSKLRLYYKRYREIAAGMGISLADESKPEKAFPPSGEGEILGIWYNLENWTWNMDIGRWSRLVRELWNMESEEGVTLKKAEVVMGKLNYYAALVPRGYRNRSLISGVVAMKKNHYDDRVVSLGKQELRQVKWWRLNLMALFHGGSRITDPRRHLLFPVDPVWVYSDAAGVTEESQTFKGLGAVNMETGKWIMQQWPRKIIKEFGKQLSLLEALAALAGLLMEAKEVQRKGSVVLMVDNIGAVWASVKESSRSKLVYTVIKAILDVADGLGVRVKMVHTGRRSDVGEAIADHLSKGEVMKARMEWGLVGNQVTVSKALNYWMTQVNVDVFLARSLLQDLSRTVEVYTGLDYDLL